MEEFSNDIFNDNCDKCGVTVRANGTATRGASILTFCGHHTNAYAYALELDGWTVTRTSDAEVKEDPTPVGV